MTICPACGNAIAGEIRYGRVRCEACHRTVYLTQIKPNPSPKGRDSLTSIYNTLVKLNEVGDADLARYEIELKEMDFVLFNVHEDLRLRGVVR